MRSSFQGSEEFLEREEIRPFTATWLRISMTAVSFLGTWYIMSALVALAVLIFWLVGLRLEATFILVPSPLSLGLSSLLKILVERTRPSAHVMAYLAFWGLLFSFGIILFREMRWRRILLLVISALLVVLVGPSHIYLGDPTGPAMSSARISSAVLFLASRSLST